MKQVTRKWLISGMITLTGVLAIVMGFSAAFGNAADGIWAVDAMHKSLYEFASGALKSHMGMAYIGGIIIGSVGVITLLGGFYALWLAYTNSLPTSRKCFHITLVMTTIIMIVAIAAVVCQLQLNSNTWLDNHIDKTNKDIMNIIGQLSKLQK